MALCILGVHGNLSRRYIHIWPSTPFRCSFLMSWFTPTVGLGCRSIIALSYFMAWCFSCALTQMFCKYTDSSRTQNAEAKRERDKRLFFAITMKDAMFATPMTLVLFLPFK